MPTAGTVRVNDMTASGDQSKQQEPERPLLDDLSRPEAYPDPRPSAGDAGHDPHLVGFPHRPRGLEAQAARRLRIRGLHDRRAAAAVCEDEVRLNRRLAPDVYLGVVPVRLGPSGHWFGPDGEIVDYAVRMRRLPDDRSMETLLRRGALTADHLQRLAARLARFFTAAAPVPRPARSKRSAGVTENFVEVEPFVGRFVSRELLDAVRDWQLGILGARRPASRSGSGRAASGTATATSGSSTSTSRTAIRSPSTASSSTRASESGDAAGDVAFLAMELAARSRQDLGESFIAEFAAGPTTTTSTASSTSTRAIARGCGARWPAPGGGSLDAPGEGGAEGRGGASALQVGPRVASERTAAGPAIAVGGVIGSGKTTLAEALGRTTGGPVISSDRSASPWPVRPTERAPEEAYSAAFSERTFDEVFRRATVVLRSGRGVILDATFRAGNIGRAPGTWRGDRTALRLRRRRSADEATLRTRLRAPGRGPLDLGRRGIAARAGPRGVRARRRARPGRARPRRHDGAAGHGRPGRAGLPLGPVGVALDRIAHRSGCAALP